MTHTTSQQEHQGWNKQQLSTWKKKTDFSWPRLVLIIAATDVDCWHCWLVSVSLVLVLIHWIHVHCNCHGLLTLTWTVEQLCLTWYLVCEFVVLERIVLYYVHILSKIPIGPHRRPRDWQGLQVLLRSPAPRKRGVARTQYDFGALRKTLSTGNRSESRQVFRQEIIMCGIRLTFRCLQQQSVPVAVVLLAQVQGAFGNVHRLLGAVSHCTWLGQAQCTSSRRRRLLRRPCLPGVPAPFQRLCQPSWWWWISVLPKVFGTWHGKVFGWIASVFLFGDGDFGDDLGGVEIDPWFLSFDSSRSGQDSLLVAGREVAFLFTAKAAIGVCQAQVGRIIIHFRGCKLQLILMASYA